MTNLSGSFVHKKLIHPMDSCLWRRICPKAHLCYPEKCEIWVPLITIIWHGYCCSIVNFQWSVYITSPMLLYPYWQKEERILIKYPNIKSLPTLCIPKYISHSFLISTHSPTHSTFTIEAVQHILLLLYGMLNSVHYTYSTFFSLVTD